MFFFCSYKLDGVFFSSSFLPSKVHENAINDLQYWGGKMTTMLEMVPRNGPTFFLREIQVQT